MAAVAVKLNRRWINRDLDASRSHHPQATARHSPRLTIRRPEPREV